MNDIGQPCNSCRTTNHALDDHSLCHRCRPGSIEASPILASQLMLEKLRAVPIDWLLELTRRMAEASDTENSLTLTWQECGVSRDGLLCVAGILAEETVRNEQSPAENPPNRG